MQILLTNGRWPEDEERFDFDLQKITETAQELLDSAKIYEADAMMGASLPAVLISLASAAAIGITILSAPTTIEQNLPKWRSYFEATVSFVRDIECDMSIDQNTARVLALEAVFKTTNCKDLKTLFVLRQTSLQGGTYDLIDDVLPINQDALSASDWNIEHSQQASARYVLGIEANGECYTIIVESDGSVGFNRRLP